MRLIHSSVTNAQQENTTEGLFKHIELCGRVAYISEGNITEDSYIRFVDNLSNLKHYSVFEHGTLYFTIPLIEHEGTLLIESDKKVLNNPFTHVVKDSQNMYVTTNYRVIVENSTKDKEGNLVLPKIEKYRVYEPTKHEKRYTFRIVCSNGISEQILRHRLFSSTIEDSFSFTKESTRYCNYTKDKFGNQLTYVIPYWTTDLQEGEWKHEMDIVNLSDKSAIFFMSCENDQYTYFNLLDCGCDPQQAREVVPKALKTEMFMTGYTSQWKEFLRLRSAKYGAKGVHPDMIVVADKIYDFFNDNNLLVD